MIPALSLVWLHVKLSDVSLETRPRYSLVADEDVKKSNKTKQKKKTRVGGHSLVRVVMVE